MGAIFSDEEAAARWRVMLMTPGAHPFEALAAQVAKLSGGDVQRLRDELLADTAALDLAIRAALVGALVRPGCC